MSKEIRQIAIYGKGGIFANELNTQPIYFVPRNNVVQRADKQINYLRIS